MAFSCAYLVLCMVCGRDDSKIHFRCINTKYSMYIYSQLPYVPKNTIALKPKTWILSSKYKT